MGRRAKPTHLKIVEHSRDRRSNLVKANEPMPRRVLSEVPCDLTASQRKIWTDTIANVPKGMLKELDSQIFLSWVCAADVHRTAMNKLKNSSLLILSKNGDPVQSPYLRIINQQAVIIKTLGAELGFSPAARTGIAIEREHEPHPNDRFFCD